jgi:hypothetical protein
VGRSGRGATRPGRRPEAVGHIAIEHCETGVFDFCLLLYFQNFV